MENCPKQLARPGKGLERTRIGKLQPKYGERGAEQENTGDLKHQPRVQGEPVSSVMSDQFDDYGEPEATRDYQ